MGRYYDMVKANYNKLRNDEGVMWGRLKGPISPPPK
jgi:hypothetical protein